MAKKKTRRKNTAKQSLAKKVTKENSVEKMTAKKTSAKKRGVKKKVATSGATVLSKEIAEQLLNKMRKGVNRLQPKGSEITRHFDDIEPSAASFLARFGGALSFRSLETVSEAAAWALAERSGARFDQQSLRISLPSLTELTDSPGHLKLASHLVKHVEFAHSLNLNSLTVLSPKAAGALAKCKGKLFLDGLRVITLTILKRLLNSMWSCLGGLTDMPDELSTAFSDKCKGVRVELPQLTTLSNHASVQLAKYNGELACNFDILPTSAVKILRNARTDRLNSPEEKLTITKPKPILQRPDPCPNSECRSLRGWNGESCSYCGEKWLGPD